MILKNNNHSGTSMFTVLAVLLTVTFVVLKLVGVISWSWIWVFSPIWIDVAFSILLIIVLSVCWHKGR